MLTGVIIRRFALAALFTLGALGAFAPARAQLAVPGADPKINARFYDADAGEWVTRFEGESREIYVKRNALVAAAGVKPGMTVADVGAGSGFMAMLFAKAVGPTGSVIASEISKPFALAIALRAKHEGIGNISTVIGTQTDTGLPAERVDIVFTSDVYHHFEQVAPTLASIKRALKPGGRFIVVDFERIPGVTPQGTLDHVRAGKQTVIEEVLAAGFKLREEVKTLGLRDNYYLIFERP